MNSSSDSAESIVRMMMQGSEVALKITGTGAKHIAVALYAMSKEEKNSKGKTNLAKMMNTKKECKVFSIKEDELKKFTKEANAYGVLFCALVNKKEKSSDGMVDLMIKAEDASKVNRIITRFKLATIDRASIKSEAERDIDSSTQINKEGKVDNINNKAIKKEDNEIDPKFLGKTSENQSKNLLNSNKELDEASKDYIRPSIKEKLKVYKEKEKNSSDIKPKDKNIEKNLVKKKNKKVAR